MRQISREKEVRPVPAEIHEDDLVARLVADPAAPPSTVMIMGYIGRSSSENCIRIYVDAHLAAHVDVPRELVLHAIKIPRAVSALGGSYVWIRTEPSIVLALAQALAKSAEAQRRIWQG
jgi:hypothetical protein